MLVLVFLFYCCSCCRFCSPVVRPSFSCCHCITRYTFLNQLYPWFNNSIGHTATMVYYYYHRYCCYRLQYYYNCWYCGCHYCYQRCCYYTLAATSTMLPSAIGFSLTTDCFYYSTASGTAMRTMTSSFATVLLLLILLFLLLPLLVL